MAVGPHSPGPLFMPTKCCTLHSVDILFVNFIHLFTKYLCAFWLDILCSYVWFWKIAAILWLKKINPLNRRTQWRQQDMIIQKASSLQSIMKLWLFMGRRLETSNVLLGLSTPCMKRFQKKPMTGYLIHPTTLLSFQLRLTTVLYVAMCKVYHCRLYSVI